MNRLVVYIGPTLAAERIRRVAPDAELLPPVEGGMLARAHLGEGDIVVLIDGCYRDRPAVRHKEILSVIHAGATVIGAASMGAMRAAELTDHGMIGVGRVFQLYRDGDIRGDDEVAVRHSPGARDYRADSVALVNLRHGSRLAVEEGVVSAATAEALVTTAASWVFDERTLPRLTSALAATLGDDERGRLPALVEHLRQPGCDLKALDAISAIEYAVHLRSGTAPRPVPAAAHGDTAGAPPWRTSYLRDWETHWGDAARGDSGDWVSAVDVLDAARLYDDGYPDVHREVLTDLLSELAAGRSSIEHHAAELLGVRPDAPLPERLAAFLSSEERRLPAAEQALHVVLRMWPANACRDWRPLVLAKLRTHPSWPEWTDLVHRADAARGGQGPQAREDIAGLLFLARWGVSGPAVLRELGRRGFMTLRGLDRVAIRFGSLELQRRAAARRAAAVEPQPRDPVSTPAPAFG